MDSKKLNELISETLLKDERVCYKTESGETAFDIPKVLDLLDKYDPVIIDIFFQSDEIRNKFFYKTKKEWFCHPLGCVAIAIGISGVKVLVKNHHGNIQQGAQLLYIAYTQTLMGAGN